ncbi:arylesterase [Flavihumibacter sp. RY-1]|uniref:Arylesterase n=1 Tax=Flavihumibacter fluminis TaxID=2909236 RepID=A0ABS9BDL2_9BACT|nr:arylesterase [Flavihumibacter fluminis]MCF1713657.1 arylesterase [Flavihumibacter fluminis]
MANNKVNMSRLRIWGLILLASGWMACGSGSQKKEAQQEVAATNKKLADKKLVFFGNSLTAGFGLDPEEAFPARTQVKIDSLELGYEVINAGLSGETSAGGLTRIDWILQQKPDIFVLELGANDGLRGIPVAETRKNLQGILDKVKAANPEVKLVVAGMMVPPNMGPEYAKDFQSIFPELAKTNNATLIPFLLDGVAGERSLNLADGIHPTAEGHQMVANSIWKYLQPLLGSR